MERFLGTFSRWGNHVVLRVFSFSGVSARQAGNGGEAVEPTAGHPADVILMDLRMPGISRVEATRTTLTAADAATWERPKIISLTTFNRDQAVVDAVQAGAAGYLVTSAEPEFLLASVRTVHAGRSVIAPGSAHVLFQHAARQHIVPARIWSPPPP